jgi:thymidylate synthase (FAD)
MSSSPIDPHFRVEVLARTEHPQTLCWWAMHQDYSENFVFDEDPPSESEAGAICVKRLLAGDRGHYGCYSDDTLVMTDTGWKAWPDVTTDDLLLAVDIETGAGRFEAPQALHAYAIAPGDHLYAAASQRLDQLVTHDHRMVVSSRRKDGTWRDFRFEKACDVVGRPVRYRVTSELACSDRRLPLDRPGGVDFADVLRLAGFYYGDGVRSSNIDPGCLRFRLRRERKINYLQELGSSVGVLEPRANDRYTLYCDHVASWIEKNFSTEHGKTVPFWLVRLPRPELLAFLEGLRSSDGTRYKPTTARGGESWAVDSCEKDALERIQAAAVLNGISVQLLLNNPNEGSQHTNHRPCWRLSFNYDRPFARFEACHGRTRGTEEAVAYEGFVYCATVSTGALLVSRNGKPVVSGNCLEHPAITFNVGGFPHSVMQQARTHRVGVSFDVQSGRYTGKRILDVCTGTRDADEVFYLRPVGTYRDRLGKKYDYTEDQRIIHRIICIDSAGRYKLALENGFSEEHARDIIPYAIRQDFVVSFNLRSLLHFLDLRAKRDAQLEIQQLCDLLWPHLEAWAPEIAAWYATSRLHKARLAP